MLAVDFADVVHAADIWMGDLAGKPDFRMKVIQSLWILGEVLGQELKGNGMSKLEVVCLVDLAHTASTCKRDNTIAVGNLCSRQKPSVMRTIRS